MAEASDLKSEKCGSDSHRHYHIIDFMEKEEDDVLQFIHRRFPEDSNWLNGNCYFFALILLDRFPIGKILYDVIDGHFVCEIDGRKYDWSGIVDESGEHNWIEWEKFYEYDPLQYQRVVKDCTR